MFHEPFMICEMEQKAMIAWLSMRDPDAWHVVIEKLNGGSAVDVRRWVADQTNCDRATAQMLFFSNDPGMFLEHSSVDAAVGAGDGDQAGRMEWLKLLVDRWNAGFYKRSEIASSAALAGLWEDYLADEAEQARDALPWHPDRSMGECFPGRDLKDSLRPLLDSQLRSLFEDLGVQLEFTDVDEGVAYIRWRKAHGHAGSV